jgi:hypothetical protein
VPIVVGHDLYLTIHHSFPAADIYSGERRCATDPPGAWTPNPAATQGEATFSYHLAEVGTRDFRGGAHEVISDNPLTYQWSYLTTQITVIGPDSDVFDGPAESNFDDPWMSLTAYFPVYAGEIDLGWDINGYLEFRLRRPDEDYDTGWITDDDFQLISGTIVCFLQIDSWDEGFINLLPGDVFDDFFLQHRLRIYDCAGTLQIYTFADRQFKFRKTWFSSFQMEEVTP